MRVTNIIKQFLFSKIVDFVNSKFYSKLEEGIKVRLVNGLAKKRKAGLILDNSKLKALGWSINTSLEQGVSKTVEEMAQVNNVDMR